MAIAGLADTVALVTVPGLGDAVQAIKAGLMEVADLVVVNMADRPGAGETVRHLRLSLGRGMPIVQTVATEATGVLELREHLDDRWQRLVDEDQLGERRERKQLDEAVLIAQEWLDACSDGYQTLDDLNVQIRHILKEANKQWPT